MDQVNEHVNNYKRYLDLTAIKKDLIQKYKESKQRFKESKLAEVDSQYQKLKSVDRSLGIKPQRAMSAHRNANKDIKQELNEWKKEKDEKLAKMKIDSHE